MFKKIMLLTATVSFFALAAPQSFAQDPLTDDWTQQEMDDLDRCISQAVYSDFEEAAGYIRQARTELRQASELRELANNARANAAASSSDADKKGWEKDAERREANAKQLEESAKRNIERAKERFRKYGRGCGDAYPAVEGLVVAIINSAEENLDNYQNGRPVESDANPESEEEETAEVAPEPQKAEKPQKKPAKPQKPKPPKKPKPSKKPKPQKGGNSGGSEAVALLAGIVVGVIGNELMDDDDHHRPHRPHRPNKHEIEHQDGGHQTMMPHKKKPKKPRKLKKMLKFL
jgi:hypothetical protein